MTSAALLPEPAVLAHTKRRLFPDSDEPNTYSVVDTQFAIDEWLPGQPIPTDVHEQLAPFNHVQLGSGYPDFVGVRLLESELLAIEHLGDQSPLIAVEAKGHTGVGTVDIEGGIIQAYDRLHEANATYVTAPAPSISQSARMLARELNVGVLGVDRDGTVAPLEVPRVVGNRASDGTTAIRFQATAHGVADKSFGLNHPKNYLGVPLALYHDADTDEVLAEHVVGATADARQGAAFLGLIEENPIALDLHRLARRWFALHRYRSVDAALTAFKDWQRSRKRFCDVAPEWGLLTRRVVWAYPATQLLVTELQTMHENGIHEPSLVDLVEWLHAQHPVFTVELFLRGTDDVRGQVLDEEGNLHGDELREGTVFHSPTVFQLKAMFYHSGILAERGAEPHRLDPETDIWRLCEPLEFIPYSFCLFPM